MWEVMMDKTVVLIVDDIETNREILKSFWDAEEEYEMKEASNSEEAIQIMKDRKDIDLLLLDVFMPGMTGLELLSYMKKDERLKKIPVIINTQLREGGIEEQALALGADDFIFKPYNAGVVRKRVDNVIRKTLYERSRRDELTGVYNCEAFYYQTRKMLLQNAGRSYSMCYLNITRFKVINEIMGIEEGDRILIMIAEALKEACNGIGTYARITADHFACCIETAQLKPGTEFDVCFNQRVSALEESYHFQLECGIYTIQDIRTPISVMCDKAKIAITEFKGNFGRRIAYYDEKLGERIQKERELVADMEKGLRTGQFFVMLQPVYNAVNGEPTSAEALVRWNHPKKGIIPPIEFISLFERNGFIKNLDAFVWEEVCRLLAAQRENGETMLPISVNVSRVDLQETDIVDKLETLLYKYGLEKRMIKLEITETTYTENPREIAAVVSEFRKRGFEILMDDFGSGYSSLNILKELPVDILKIDMRFVDNFSFSKRAGNIIISIVRMIKLLNMGSVAEGVETKEQAEFLKNVGCDSLQGYYFSKPLSIEDYRKRLKEARRATDPSVPYKEVILTVDDVKMVRTSLMDCLGDTYQYYQAENGKEALEILKRSAGNINLVITDIVMPEMDGFELIKKMKENEIYSHIPVIVITANGERENEIKALSLGAVDVIIKPYDPTIVKHRVKNVLKLSEIEWLQMKMEVLGGST